MLNIYLVCILDDDLAALPCTQVRFSITTAEERKLANNVCVCVISLACWVFRRWARIAKYNLTIEFLTYSDEEVSYGETLSLFPGRLFHNIRLKKFVERLFWISFISGFWRFEIVKCSVRDAIKSSNMVCKIGASMTYFKTIGQLAYNPIPKHNNTWYTKKTTHWSIDFFSLATILPDESISFVMPHLRC